MQNLHHLTHRCIKGLWIIKQVCTSFVVCPRKTEVFFTLAPHPFSVSLALRSAEILMLRDTCVVSPLGYDGLCGFRFALRVPFWESSPPGRGVGTGGGVQSGKYSATAASAWQHPGWKLMLSVRTYPTLPLCLFSW